jgi:ubiquitin carboxyl-terminal hydrolase 8
MSHPSPTQSSINGGSLKIPRKRPVPLAGSQTSASSTESPGRPSSASTFSPPPPPSYENSTHLPAQTRRVDVHVKTSDRSRTREIVFPKANVIEPSLLRSYLTQPSGSRPLILLLDVRPKEQYERGCIDAEYVVWIDPILLDDE